MSNNQFNLHYEAELNEGVKVTTLSPVFCSGDIDAHSFIVKVMRNGKPVNLAGTTVRGFFIRPDNVTITLEGSVNADGEAVVTLSNACYNKQGRFQLVIRVTMAGVISTVFCGIGGMLLTITDGFIDEDNVIPSLGDLLAQIDAMKEATAAALEAADRANEAAENAGGGAGYPVVGYVDANNNIILTSSLASDTYTFKYENTDGTQVVIGTVEVSGSESGGDSGDNGEVPGEDPDEPDEPEEPDEPDEPTPTYDNALLKAIGTDGQPYNGGKGWKDGYRLNSSAVETAEATADVTGFIPVEWGDKLYLSGVTMTPNSAKASQTYIYLYRSDFTHTGSYFRGDTHFETALTKGGIVLDANSIVKSIELNLNTFNNSDGSSAVKYVRISCDQITDASIITVNEPIE